MAIVFGLIENISSIGSISPCYHKLRLSMSTPLIHVHTHTHNPTYSHSYTHIHTHSHAHTVSSPFIEVLVTGPPFNLSLVPSLLSSIQFNHSVVSNCLRPHGLQQTRLPYASPTPRACSKSCPLSQWCHPAISSSVVPFSYCLQSFPELGSFLKSQFFASSGQSIGVSASASVLPMNIQDWFPLGLTSWISLQSKGLSRVFSNTTVQKHQFFSARFSL